MILLYPTDDVIAEADTVNKAMHMIVFNKNCLIRIITSSNIMCRQSTQNKMNIIHNFTHNNKAIKLEIYLENDDFYLFFKSIVAGNV